MKRFYLLFLLSALLLSSCARIVPVTNQIINQVGRDRLDQFQYYVSKKITMERTDESSNAAIVEGRADIVNRTLQEKVVIRKSTPGVVIHSNYFTGSGYVATLYASFTDSDSRYLEFYNFDDSYKGNFYLLSMDKNQNETYGGIYVNYDGHLYRYSTPQSIIAKALGRTSEQPKLLIKLKRKDIVDRNRRREKGRRIGD